MQALSPGIMDNGRGSQRFGTDQDTSTGTRVQRIYGMEECWKWHAKDIRWTHSTESMPMLWTIVWTLRYLMAILTCLSRAVHTWHWVCETGTWGPSIGLAVEVEVTNDTTRATGAHQHIWKRYKCLLSLDTIEPQMNLNLHQVRPTLNGTTNHHLNQQKTRHAGSLWVLYLARVLNDVGQANTSRTGFAMDDLTHACKRLNRDDIITTTRDRFSDRHTGNEAMAMAGEQPYLDIPRKSHADSGSTGTRHKHAAQTMLATRIRIYRKVCEEMTGQIQDNRQVLTIGSTAWDGRFLPSSLTRRV